ncbi:hypothetical protein V2J09_010020 [Rumex salicifolius]
MAMGFTMGLNFLLLVAMVAANILSLYHLLITTTPTTPLYSNTAVNSDVPEHLVRQLQTIRATINHLTRLQQQNQPPPSASRKPNSAAAPPPDLLLYSNFAPIASSCHEYPELLHQYMTYTPFSICPSDSLLAESLILRGCHPLPRRRCFSRTPPNPKFAISSETFPISLPDSNVLWKSHASPSSSCKSFKCLNPSLGFDMAAESLRFVTYKSDLDLTVSQLIGIAKSANSPIRLGIDVGGGTGTFAARMKERNVTVVTTTMDLGAPYSEAAALRGLVPLHAPLQQRLPVFNGAVDLIRCGRAVNRWIPFPALEFLLFDLDRVLRGGGFLWIDHFFSKGEDSEKIYKPLIGKLGYKIVKWATGTKTDSKKGEVFLTALLQKPKSRQFAICKKLSTLYISSILR